jgi:predicted nuclease of predicted toxin-antitoxin system
VARLTCWSPSRWRPANQVPARSRCPCGPRPGAPDGGLRCVRLVDVLDRTATDQEVWAHACTHGWILITCNPNDFLALATATSSHSGVIILTRRRTRQAEASHVLTLLRRAGEQGSIGNINFA